MRFHALTSVAETVALVNELGFLPMFDCGIDSFSVEALTPRELWFVDGVDGPWEWKGPVACSNIFYGKFFKGRAGYISAEWFPIFANYRRDGYDFESRVDSGLMPNADRRVYETLAQYGTLLSNDLHAKCGLDKSFDTVITRLQMQTYVTTFDFEYARTKRGEPYGWGIARYGLPELRLPDGAMERVYETEPAESKIILLNHFKKILPGADEKKLVRLLG